MKSKIFVILFFIFVSLSIFSVFINTGKFFIEINKWGKMSDYEKRYEIFGNLYDFIIFLNSEIPKNSTVLVYTDHGMMHLLGRYYLYPKRIVVVKNEEIFMNSYKEFDYYAIYNKQNLIKKKSISKFISKNKKDFGEIYKND